MFVQVINYQFKGSAEKEQGLAYINDTLIPHEHQKFGFISHHLLDGNNDDIYLMYRYKVKENRLGKPVDKDGYQAFSGLWKSEPRLIAGPNYASPKFHNLNTEGASS